MKRFLFFLFLSILIMSCARQKSSQVNLNAEERQIEAAAELSFLYTHLSGMASNQFAVWIEDTQGKHIKTLYATRWTANGGWSRRSAAIPVWVKKSGLSDLSKAQIDAISGATPKTGTLTYVWDGTDSLGSPVASGEYFLFLEGTLRWENQVLYRALIRPGQGRAVSEVSVEYKGDAGSDRQMISDVKVITSR